jgi:hypothetical protein
VHGKNKKNALIKLLLWSYPLNQVRISNSLSNKGSDNQLFSSLTERIIPDKARVGNGVFPHPLLEYDQGRVLLFEYYHIFICYSRSDGRIQKPEGMSFRAEGKAQSIMNRK